MSENNTTLTTDYPHLLNCLDEYADEELGAALREVITQNLPLTDEVIAVLGEGIGVL